MILLAPDLTERPRLSDATAMALLLLVADEVFAEAGHDAIITSGIEGAHKPGSLHPLGKALDFRLHHIPWSHRGDIRDAMARRLGPDFDVLLELNPLHLHVEHDPHPG